MSQPDSVVFEARDGLRVHADFYEARRARAVLVLCHRSHFNRGEYREIAPGLVGRGYSCLAIDLRSGMNVLGYRNETAMRARARGLSTGYLATRPDIEGAIDHAVMRAGGKPVVLVGSSYSAALALVLASEPSALCAAAAFSPGEYLKGMSVAETMAGLMLPTFVTAASKELAATRALMKHAPRRLVTFYAPRGEGAHGARALWATSAGNREYWRAFVAFLECVTVS